MNRTFWKYCTDNKGFIVALAFGIALAGISLFYGSIPAAMIFGIITLFTIVCGVVDYRKPK